MLRNPWDQKKKINNLFSQGLVSREKSHGRGLKFCNSSPLSHHLVTENPGNRMRFRKSCKRTGRKNFQGNSRKSIMQSMYLLIKLKSEQAVK